MLRKYIQCGQCWSPSTPARCPTCEDYVEGGSGENCRNPWSGRRDVCRHCGDLHHSIHCPILIAPAGDERLLEQAVKFAAENTSDLLERYKQVSDPCYNEFLSQDYASSVLEKENIPLPRREGSLKKKPSLDTNGMRVELTQVVSAVKSGTTNGAATEPLEHMSGNPNTSSPPRTDDVYSDEVTASDNPSAYNETDTTMSSNSGWSLVTRRSASKKRRSGAPLQEL